MTTSTLASDPAAQVVPPKAPTPKLPASKYVPALVALIVGASIALFMPAVGGLTPEGVNALAVIVTVTILWVTIGTGWPSLFALGLLVVAGVFTPAGVWAASLGNPTVAMVLVFTFVAQAFAQAGVIDAVTTWMLTRRYLRGRPRLFLATLMFTHIFLGLLMNQGIALGIIFINLIDKMMDRLGVPKGHSLGRVAVSGALWAHAAVIVASPIAGTWPIVVIGLLAGHGITVTFGQWLAFGIPWAILAFGAMFVATLVGKPDVTPLRNLDLDEFARSTPPLSAKGKVAALVGTVMAALLLAPDVLNMLGILAPVADFLSRVGITIPAIAAVTVMCLVRVKGEPVMDYAVALKNTPVPVIVFLASLFAISSVFSIEGLGITAWLHGILEPLVAGLTPFWLLVAILAVSIVLTNIMSSAVVFALSWAVTLALLAGTDINIAPFAVLVVMASMQAVLTEPSQALAAVAYGTGRITTRSALRSNLTYIGLALPILVALFPLVSWILPAGTYGGP